MWYEISFDKILSTNLVLEKREKNISLIDFDLLELIVFISILSCLEFC